MHLEATGYPVRDGHRWGQAIMRSFNDAPPQQVVNELRYLFDASRLRRRLLCAGSFKNSGNIFVK